MRASPFFITALLFVLTSVASATDARMLRRGNGPEPASLDAHRAQDIASHSILRDLYEGLVTEDAAGRIVPGMAERWEVSADGLHYRFLLRPDLRWSNGEPLRADAIVASFARALNPETAAPLASLLVPIRGATSSLAGDASGLAIQSFGADEIRIDLERPAPLLRLLALPISLPVNLSELAQHGKAHTQPGNLVSNGAYRLQSWQPHAGIVLERNPHFHSRDTVQIERVRFVVTEDASNELRRFQAGDLDFTETVPPARLDRLRERFGSQLRISPYLGSFFLGLNVQDPLLGHSPELRRALSLAIDRDILTRYITALGEQSAYALVPPGVEGYRGARMPESEWTQPQRLSEARNLIEALRSKRSQPIEVEIRYNTSTAHRRLSLAIAAMWREALGITVRLRNEEWKSFVQTRRDRRITQVFRGGWIADVADPLSFLALFDGEQALNWSGWVDPEFQSLLDRADQDADARLATLQLAEQRLLDAHVLIPVYFYTSRHLVHEELEGFEANLLDRHPSRWMRFRDAGQAAQ